VLKNSAFSLFPLSNFFTINDKFKKPTGNQYSQSKPDITYFLPKTGVMPAESRDRKNSKKIFIKKVPVEGTFLSLGHK